MSSVAQSEIVWFFRHGCAVSNHQPFSLQVNEHVDTQYLFFACLGLNLIKIKDLVTLSDNLI
jgi:hypothetical protein